MLRKLILFTASFTAFVAVALPEASAALPTCQLDFLYCCCCDNLAPLLPNIGSFDISELAYYGFNLTTARVGTNCNITIEPRLQPSEGACYLTPVKRFYISGALDNSMICE
ncbi:hypothetical protein BDN70DRAFT_887565 [Pholiota conissans]|uniref:Uncharacterized protein n=1 Tax=Pholiota conissans TaxID=109636 RepID=A0A9P5YQN7_9AGAR|nr:hypothetical protein BDN70DRAFT_887565 [Pholiota conissans]